MSFKPFFAGLLILAATSLTSFAQPDVVIRLSNTNDGEEQLQQLLDNFRSAAQFRINGRIMEIERACDLDKSQLKRLRAASKGAMKDFYNAEKEEKEKTLRRYQEQAGIDPDADDDDNIEVNRSIAFVMRVKEGDLIEKEPLWVKSVGKILTDEQKKKLEQARKDQDEFFKKAAIDQFVARLEIQLFLNPEQRDQVRQVVDEHLAKYVVRTLYEKRTRNNAIREIGIQDVESEYGEFVEAFLTEDQLKEWNRWVEPEIKRLKRLPRQ